MSSWSSVTSSASIFDTTTIQRGGLYATSTCTIRPANVSNTYLRQYGVTSAQLIGSFDPSDALNAQTLAQAAGYSPANIQAAPSSSTGFTKHLGYLEGTAGTSQQDFSIYPFSSLGSYPITNTSLPGERNTAQLAEPFVFLFYDNSASPGPIITQPQFGQMYAQPVVTLYKDPCVVYLASIQRWLLVLCRVRNLESGPPGPRSSVSDIVAYTALDPEFTTDVLGPYWVLSSLNAIPGLNTRLWLGVPSAFEVVSGAGGLVYIYYTLDESDLLGVTDPFTGTQLADTGATYPSPFGGSGSAQNGPIPGIGVCIVDAQHFALTPPSEASWGRPTDDRWEDTSASPPITTLRELFDLQVPKIFRGLARLWMARIGSKSNEVVGFEEASFDLRAVDPVVVCDSASNPRSITNATQFEDQIALLFATSPLRPSPNAPVEHGVWRATPCSDGLSLDIVSHQGTSVMQGYTAHFGVDFILRGVSFDSNLLMSIDTTDRIIASDESTYRYIDPDPARLYAATWRLFMGRLDVNAVNTPTALVYVESSVSQDLFVPLSMGWT